ncbi:DUF4369 domain-containing protein [Porticoccaceae bacterium LTM1]|nr:DUF4369 domain-containing protein [Porticoccaceae bacterium LTM1]
MLPPIASGLIFLVGGKVMFKLCRLLLILMLGAFSEMSMASGGFVLSGEVKEIPDQLISVTLETLPGMPKKTYSGSIIDGKFEIKGEIANPPSKASLHFEKGKYFGFDSLYLSNTEMNLSVSLDKSMNGFSVLVTELSGSPAHDKYLKCSGQLFPDSKLSFSSAITGGIPPLYW